MKKEELIALGLTEELAQKVLDGFGTMVPKSRLDDKIQENKDLTTQLKDRDTQLEELKKVDAKGLQTKIEELQQENTDAKAKYESDLKETQLSNAIKLALHGKVHDTDITSREIDKTAIELDVDGNITKGLEEQLKTLQESKSFLFVPKSSPLPAGVKPGEGKKDDGNANSNDNYGKRIAEEVSGNTQHLTDARKSYFE
ncbi:phage scaffolding protein [Lysinibacillus sp. NPDC086135]|uniref:phage scaffolding protein n=1 Tax=Lysinibacillus sp. NPDC086135 TaxID=3364130 RepID=UPI0037F49BE0